MRRRRIILLSLLICFSACRRPWASAAREAPPAPGSPGAAPPGAEVVSFRNGALTLYGVLYRPAGDGPFPALLYNHGSAPGMLNNEAFGAIGPRFQARGWIFFAPWRRGQGLSASAGPFISDEIHRGKSLTHLLETDHLSDQLAGLAWLRSAPFVAKDRIAVAGNSLGGILAVFGAEREPYCAAVDASGGAMSWKRDAELPLAMERAVRNARSPIFFFQAENDFDLTPTRTLSAAMTAAGHVAEAKIYPRYGDSHADGHSFAYRGSDVWFPDVLAFLEKHCPVKDR
jgi:dipeptidyl aminopeptidase/acylaminoacyl peptidase